MVLPRSSPRAIACATASGVVESGAGFMPAVIFVGYLFYGLIRPWVKREWRREIEEDPDEPEEPEEENNAA